MEASSNVLPFIVFMIAYALLALLFRLGHRQVYRNYLRELEGRGLKWALHLFEQHPRPGHLVKYVVVIPIGMLIGFWISEGATALVNDPKVFELFVVMALTYFFLDNLLRLFQLRKKYREVKDYPLEDDRRLSEMFMRLDKLIDPPDDEQE